MIWIENILWLVLGVAVVLVFRSWKRKPINLERWTNIMQQRLVRVAFYVVCVYVTIGFIDQIEFPKEGSVRNVSLIDLAFSFAEQERTYSAPFADTVTGLTNAVANDPRNEVKGIHLLGTDINGYDVLYQIAKGCGTVLLLSLGSNLVSFPIGILLGILAGYFGGWVDDLIQWLYTTVASIPWLLFVIAFLMVFGKGLFWICVAIGITSWVELARLIRGETLKLKNLDYITAARATGLPVWKILLQHLLPNLRYIIIISFTLSTSSVILAESVLTFIGIGVQPGTASWGAMLLEAQKELTRSPVVWWVFFAASFVGILPLVLSLNLFGDALRDAFDPKLKGAK